MQASGSVHDFHFLIPVYCFILAALKLHLATHVWQEEHLSVSTKARYLLGEVIVV